MATRRKAFEGTSRTSLIAAIVSQHPPAISSVQAMSPPALDHVVRKCLEKDPEDRWQSARDVMAELQWIAGGGSHAGEIVSARRRLREGVAWALCAVSALAALGLGVAWGRRGPERLPLMRFQVANPPGVTEVGPPIISPDGRTLAFDAADASGQRALWVRPLEALESRRLPDTEGAIRPIWSPDSKHIAFIANGKLRRMPVSGGPSQTIADVQFGADGTWGPNGVILFDGRTTDPVMRVDATGGVPRPEVTPDPRIGAIGAGYPVFLPGGREFLYYSLSAKPEDDALMVRVAGRRGQPPRDEDPLAGHLRSPRLPPLRPRARACRPEVRARSDFDEMLKYRHRVLGLLILLFAITYIDRVCISVAGPRMQEELGIDPVGWGWVTAMFTLSYCMFEIPTGALGDRLGPRRVLTRVVLWWSAFTSLTGAVSHYSLLLLTRFCFGAGEAGAFPNASIVVSRWFPPTQRASISGVLLMASQIGGAIAPLLVVPIQMRYGWRASFYVFGAVGLLWAAVWYWWFRDSPEEMPRVSPAERSELAGLPATPVHGFPWRIALRSQSVLAMLGTAFCYVYVYSFFQTWFHTFLVKGRGFREATLLLSALPYAVAACANLAGGAASDALVRRLGVKRGRRSLGIVGLGSACLFTVAVMFTRHQLLTVVLLSLVYGAITFQQSGVFGTCLDIGGKHAGSVVGLMNTSAQVGGLLSSVAYGYIVQGSQSYDAPFVPMAVLLALGTCLWLKIDASEQLSTESLAA